MTKYERNIYLSNLDLSEAIKVLKSNLNSTANTERIDVCDGLSRVSAEPIYAKVSSPYYNASAMDGVCVQFEKTQSANDVRPLQLKKDMDFKFVNTGNEIVAPFDAVIMIEDIVQIDADLIEIYAPASPWQHVRNIGEDIVISELIIPAFHHIRAIDIGALIAGGIRDLEVVKKPIVAIIPTGSEIIDYQEDISVGKILDSNSRMFEALIKEAGGECLRYNPISDDYDLILETVMDACKKSDMVVIGAGSSAGSKDYTRSIIEQLGELLFHGVSIKPGKPTIVGKVCGKCIFGIPGYPVSSYFAFSHFVTPAINEMLHNKEEQRIKVFAKLTTRVYSSLKHLEFVRVTLGRVSGELIVSPLNRGAGVTMSLVNADGVLIVPKNSEGFESGEVVEIELLRNIDTIDDTIVSIGSHDVILDILNNLLHLSKHPNNLSSTHIGSMGGVIAFKGGKCHIAPVHLLDELSGDYNIPYIRKYLSDIDCVLVKGVKRTQGIMQRNDATAKVTCISDLLKKDVTFVNRQKGSGTRMLVDYLLKKDKIDIAKINGYNREMNTHMMVASAVESKSAIAGIGVLSAANAMGLAFTPIGDEDYDLIVRKDILDSSLFLNLLSCLESDAFKRKLEALGGYRTDNIGQIIEL